MTPRMRPAVPPAAVRRMAEICCRTHGHSGTKKPSEILAAVKQGHQVLDSIH